MIRESIEHFRNPEEIISHHIVLIAFLSLVLNSFNLAFTHHLSHNCGGHDHQAESKHGHSHGCCSNKHKHNDDSTMINTLERNKNSTAVTDLEMNTADDSLSSPDISEVLSSSTKKLIAGITSPPAPLDLKGTIFSSQTKNSNIRAMVVHLVFDVIASLVVLFSSLMIRFFGIEIFDPICSSIIAVCIVAATLPLLKESKKLLYRDHYDFGLILRDCSPADSARFSKKAVKLVKNDQFYLFVELDERTKELLLNDNLHIFCERYKIKSVLFNLN